MKSTLTCGLMCGVLAALPLAARFGHTAETPAASAAPPLLIDLDKFDAAKRFVSLPNGMRLAYLEWGNPRGRPVVLIHGYTDNARDWVPLLPFLSPAYRLILIDIRGHGASSKPECCYDRLDFAYDVKLLMDALHIEQADIVGHSLGSIITQTLAEFWPERVRRVVLISSSGSRPQGAPSKTSSFDFLAEIKKLKEPIDPDSPFMIAWWDSPRPVNAEFIRRQRRDAAGIPLRVWLAVIDQGLAADDLQRTLPRLKAPALLLWGEKDPLIEEPRRQSLREALPAATVKVFPGLGHNPFWEEPRDVAAVINQFLDARP